MLVQAALEVVEAVGLRLVAAEAESSRDSVGQFLQLAPPSGESRSFVALVLPEEVPVSYFQEAARLFSALASIRVLEFQTSDS